MSNNCSPMSLLVEAAKKKGVRLQESDFCNEDIERLNNYVMVFRGAACDLINSIFEGDKRGVAAHQVVHNLRLHLGSANRRVLGDRNVGQATDSV